MNIKDLLTKEQYKEQLEEYNKFKKNKNTFCYSNFHFY